MRSLRYGLATVAKASLGGCIVSDQSGAGLVVAGACLGLAYVLKPRKADKEVDTVLAVVNGDIEATGVQTVDQVPKSGGRGSTSMVRVRKARKVGRIPVLAGEVASGLKMRHGMLVDSAENRQLIRSDAARRTEALRRDKDPMFVNLRNHDMHLVIMHASKMYWIMSDDEEYVQELYSKSELTSRRARRNKVAVSPTSC
jgi:hypothetical protein